MRDKARVSETESEEEQKGNWRQNIKIKMRDKVIKKVGYFTPTWG